MTAIAAEKYVRLTTFTKDGRRKETPVWIADLGDGTVGFTTDTSAWKVKRINNTPAVELVPSNTRGKVADGAASVSGTAVVVTGAAFAPVEAAVKSKYGVQYRMINFVSKITKRIKRDDNPGVGIVITLD
ncbi:MAG: PPOX class probable F420-dependent enzyme [Candidatus Aldehydirespiratoraceae bacterium]|jgi:PPOX class probable F420-dependent enzyme